MLISNEESILNLYNIVNRKLTNLLEFIVKEVIRDIRDSKKNIFNFY